MEAGETEMKKRIRNGIILLLCSVIVGSLLLTLIYMLPVESARKHAEESLYEMMDIQEDPEGNVRRKRLLDIKESFTDCLMVQNALEKVEGKSAWAHAMYAYHYDLQDDTDTTWRTEDSLAFFLRQGSEGMYLKEYSRYWHGYLVVLKPLLMCMSWKHIETLLIIVQIMLVLAVVALACYKRKAYIGIGVIWALLFMKPLRMWISLSLSSCWLITLAAVLVLLLFYDKMEKRNHQEEFFLLIGVVTAYMDFLTYPVVVLGVPLCVWLLLDMEAERGWRERLSRTFWICACWAAGYIGMWGMKWVVAELTCRTGTLRNAAWAVIFRASPLDGYTSFFSGVGRTFRAVVEQYDSAIYGIAFAVLAVSTLVSTIWCLVKACNANWGVSVICLFVTALFPIGWLVLTQNHTAIHCEFTFRIMGVSIMALWCITVSSILTIRRKIKNG